MLRPRAPSDHAGLQEPPPSPTQPSKAKKASTACLACKQRKTKVRYILSLVNPALPPADLETLSDLVAQFSALGVTHASNVGVVIAIVSTTLRQRRKLANQRNIKELAQRMEEVERHRVILGAMLATLRAGSDDSIQDLIKTVQSRTPLPDLATYLDTSMSTAPAVREAYEEIDFDLDSSPRHPTGVDEGSAVAESSTTRTGERMQMNQGQTREGPGLTPAQLRASVGEAMQIDDTTPHAIQGAETEGSDGASSTKSAKSNPSNRPWELH